MLLYILSCSALCIALAWYYRNFIVPYSGIPAKPMALNMLKTFLVDIIMKSSPPQHCYFQKMIDLTKSHLSDGLCLAWIVEPKLLIFGEEPIKVFSNEPSCVNKSAEYNILQEYFGKGLITVNGKEWNKRRKMLNPIFHVGMLKNKEKIFNKNATALVNTLMQEENKSSLCLIRYLQFCAFNNIAEFVLGLKAEDPKGSEKMKRMIRFAEESERMTVIRFYNPWLRPKFTMKLFSGGRHYLRGLEDLNEILTTILLDIKEALLSGNSGEKNNEVDADVFNTPRKSFGEILMEHHLKDSSYTVKDMMFEISSFIFAGYDTISYSMMWCLYCLGCHPEVQERVYREVEGLNCTEISYDDLQKLKYLECVILEALRLYPVVPTHARYLEKNVQCGKYNIPSGTTVVFVPYIYHRNPDIYPDPEKFDPERFMKAGSDKRPWTHIPFSEGIRNCIGKKFAMMEMKITLARIVQSFKLRSLDRIEESDLCWEIVLRSIKPIRMQLIPRQ